jgi:hypothetical protein
VEGWQRAVLIFLVSLVQLPVRQADATPGQTLRQHSRISFAANHQHLFLIRQIHFVDRARDRIAAIANYMEINFGGANIAVTK